MHNLLFCVHALCMNYKKKTHCYWLVPQYGVNNYCVLCTVQAKKANKNLQQRTLTSFITILLVLTMIKLIFMFLVTSGIIHCKIKHYLEKMRSTLLQLNKYIFHWTWTHKDLNSKWRFITNAYSYLKKGCSCDP